MEKEFFPHIVERHTECPLSVTCSAKRIFEDDQGKYWTLYKDGHYKPHMCRGQKSVLPPKLYTGLFHNKLTGKDRYNGPWRMRSSAERPPAGTISRKAKQVSNGDEWELLTMYIVDNIEWREAKEDE